MGKARVFLHFDARGILEFGAAGDVEIVCIDTRSPNDRVYVSKGHLSQAEFDAEVDARISEEPRDE